MTDIRDRVLELGTKYEMDAYLKGYLVALETVRETLNEFQSFALVASEVKKLRAEAQRVRMLVSSE